MKREVATPPVKRVPSDPLLLHETMAVEDKYAPMLYDHCYIKELPAKPSPTPGVEPSPLPSLAPVSPSAVPPSKPAVPVVKKEVEEVKPVVAKKKKSKKTFPRRAITDEEDILRRFESGGFDEEDVEYLRGAFEQLRQNEETPWAHKLCWLNPPSAPTGSGEDEDNVKPAARRKARQSEDVFEIKHKTGCARTEGYYKLSHKQKRSLVRRTECTFERTIVQSEQVRLPFISSLFHPKSCLF